MKRGTNMYMHVCPCMCLTWLKMPDPPAILAAIHLYALFIASAVQIPFKLCTKLHWSIVISVEREMALIDLALGRLAGS